MASATHSTYLIEVGNSGIGVMGLSAHICGRTEDEAFFRLRKRLEEWGHPDSGLELFEDGDQDEWGHVYVNPAYLTAKNPDVSIEDEGACPCEVFSGDDESGVPQGDSELGEPDDE